MKQLISQFSQTPCLIAPQFIESLNAVDNSDQQAKAHLTVQALSMFTGEVDGDYKPYRFEEGIAIIQVRGSLIHEYGWSCRYATGYDVIRRKLEYARADPQTKGVLIRFHSPGGSAFGCPDTGDLIAELAKEKPVWTLAEDMALSAAQWLHSQGSRRLITQSGSLGSIGVVMAHADVSKAYSEAGIKITLIHAGEHKVDGSPYKALSKQVKEELEASCEKTRQQFAQAVARGTGLSVDDVLATEASTYLGQDAVELGLADAVVSPHTILQEFKEFIHEANAPQSLTQMGNTMDPNKEKGANQGADSGQQAGAPAIGQDASSERSRIKSIISCEVAKGREAMANHLAFDTEMSAEEAEKLLSFAPLAQKAEVDTPVPEKGAQGTGSDAFLDAMGNESHPNLSADSDEQEDKNSPAAQASAIMADFSAATGFKA